VLVYIRITRWIAATPYRQRHHPLLPPPHKATYTALQ
jgi:hypothetical protein